MRLSTKVVEKPSLIKNNLSRGNKMTVLTLFEDKSFRLNQGDKFMVSS